MSIMEAYFNDLHKRSKQQHIECIIHNKAHIHLVFEEDDYKDSDYLPVSGKGLLRCAVLNLTHRNVSVTFKSKVPNNSLKFKNSSPGICNFTAFRRIQGKLDPVYHKAMPVELNNNTEESQAVIETNAVLEPEVSDGKLKAPFKPRQMINVVDILRSSQTDSGRDAKGEKTSMPKDYLKAIGKAVSKLAGPLGAPLEGLLSLYEDEKKDKKNEELQRLLESSSAVNQESLRAIFDVRTRQNVTYELLIELSALVLEQMRLKPMAEPENIATAVKSSLKSKKTSINVTTEDTLVGELRNIWGADSQGFLAVLQLAGFPVTKIIGSGSTMVLFTSFIRECRGQEPALLCETFSKLSEESPGSKVLKEAASVYCEAT